MTNVKVSVDEVTEKLRSVIDPEVGLNIVDMGLVYGVTVEGGRVEVRMTLTTRGCPMGSYMNQEVNAAVGALDGVNEVNVEIVWDPPWSPDRIVPEAMEALRAGRPY
jgi:metal-sulfur cluster biosynthetic enzyme